MPRHIRDLVITSINTLPLAIVACCLICILFTVIVLHPSHAKTKPE